MIKAILVLLFFAHLSFAGNRVGNGGNVVLCPQKVQLLDFYEADHAPAETKIKGNYQDVVDQRITLLEKVAPKLAGQYRRRAKNFHDEIEFKSGVNLTSVADSLHAFEPKQEDCKVKQIALRQDIPAGQSKRFLIDKDLWSKLDAENQAGLILHEIIYEHFSKLGATDSRKARKLNAYLFSPALEEAGSGKFWLMIKDLGITLYP